MAENSNNSNQAGIGEIQWHLLDGGGGLKKIPKTTGIKIEYSLTDEIDFAQKLSTLMRKDLMRQLLQHEKYMYQQELNNIGLLHSRDTVCEDIRKFNSKLQHQNNTNFIVTNAQDSKLSKLFKMYEN